jgi:hypothetical protein
LSGRPSWTWRPHSSDWACCSGRRGPGAKADWVDVGGPSQIRYYWSPDETVIRIQYRYVNGETRTTSGNLGRGGEFRDPQGRPIARLIKAAGVVVQLSALEDLAETDDNPRLCKDQPDEDRNGARAADRDYEDFVKRYVNRDKPTPRGFGYALVNPVAPSGLTYFDDCRRSDGAMIEAKNNYAGLIARLGGNEKFYLRDQWLEQSKNQLAAAPDR